MKREEILPALLRALYQTGEAAPELTMAHGLAAALTGIANALGINITVP